MSKYNYDDLDAYLDVRDANKKKKSELDDLDSYLDARATALSGSKKSTNNKELMNINIGKQESRTTPEQTFLDKARHQASIYGHAAIKGPLSIPGLAMDAIPALINAGLGAYRDLAMPEGRDVFSDTIPQMALPSSLLDKMLTDKKNNPFAFGTPQNAGERVGTDILSALTGTKAIIKAGEKGVGALSKFLSAGPKTQLASAAAGAGAGGIARETDHGIGTQIAASLLAGGVASVPGMLSNTPEQIAASALRYATPIEQRAAQELMDSSYRLGSPITAAEALAQVKGNSTLQPVQRVIEQSAGGGPTMERFMQGRAQGNENALRNAMGDIAPNPAGRFSDVSDIPLGMQQAAVDAIEDVKAQRTALTNPLYKAASEQSLKKEQIQPIMQALDREIQSAGENTDTGRALINYKNKLMTTVSEPVTKIKESSVLDQFGKPVSISETTLQNQKGYQTQIGPLETAYQETRNKLDLPVVSPNALLNSISGKLSPINYQLGQALSTNTNIAQGRNIHAKISESLVNPLEMGQVGQIAKDSTMRGQGATLLPTNPMAYDERSVASTIGKLNEQNPDIAKSWVRQFLTDNFNEASQNLQSGKNQFGAAKFASNISGNSQQAKNLKAAIDTATGSPEAYNGFKKMLDVFEAQGKRLQVGSPTTNNAEIINILKGSGTDNILPSIVGAATGAASGGVAGLSAGAGLKGVNMLNSWYQNLKYGRNTGRMADILTSPDGINKLQQLAKVKASSPAAAIIVRSIINPLQSNTTTP